MELRTLRYEVDGTDGADGAVRVVTLDRPDRLNAWTARMAVEYRWALLTADADPDVRAVVVTGAGRGFCAGADVKALGTLAGSGEYRSGTEEAPALPADVVPDFAHDFTFPLGLSIPVIAAINGPAAGVGLAVALFTDVRFAAADAKLTTSFARLGLPAEHGLSWLLPRLVGVTHAADLLLSSRIVLGEEAALMGMVNAALPAADVLPHALAYARRLAAETSPSSVTTLKRQLWADQLRGLHDAAADAEALLHRMIGEADFREGSAALAEKRPPEFGPRTVTPRS